MLLSQCHYAERHIFTLSVALLNVVKLSVIMLSVTLLNVVKLSVIMLSVVAP
jgi:hypothetical protein